MTEQMAIEYLLNRYLVVGSPVNPPKEECEKQNAVIDMAIQALEKQSMINEILNEMWQLNEIAKGYCEVGTLEEFKQYRAIGTVEELQALKENQRKCEDCAGCTNWNCDCYNERVMAIEEFAERIMENCSMSEMNRKMIKQIAESMKGEKE